MSLQNMIHNVLDYGATAGDVLDATAAINAAATAAGAVMGTVVIPAGTYYVKGQINIPANIVVRGESSALTVLHVKSDANSSLATMFCQGENITIMDLQIQFDQPDNPGVTLSNIQPYNPAIIVGARNRVRSVLIGAAWDGLWLQYYGASQTIIENVNIGAFNQGIVIGNASDIITIINPRFHAFGMGDNNSQIYNTSNQTSVSISIEQGDPVHIFSPLFGGAGRGLVCGAAGGRPYVTLVAPWLDSYKTIEVTNGNVSVFGGDVYCSGTTKIIQTGGSLKLEGITHFLSGAGASPHALISISGGITQISSNVFKYENNGGVTDQTAVLSSGGSLQLTDSHIDHGSTGSTAFTNPTISITGGQCRIETNVCSAISAGSGTFISRTGSGALDRIAGNISPGWFNSIPCSVLAEDASNDASLTINSLSLAQPFGNTNNFSGLFILSDTNWTASTAVFVVGTGGVSKIADSNSAFTTVAGFPGKANVYLNANMAVEIQNNYTVTPSITYRVWAVRTKNST